MVQGMNQEGLTKFFGYVLSDPVANVEGIKMNN